jgi:hypothetical protein
MPRAQKKTRKYVFIRKNNPAKLTHDSLSNKEAKNASKGTHRRASKDPYNDINRRKEPENTHNSTVTVKIPGKNITIKAKTVRKNPL